MNGTGEGRSQQSAAESSVSAEDRDVKGSGKSRSQQPAAESSASAEDRDVKGPGEDRASSTAGKILYWCAFLSFLVITLIALFGALDLVEVCQTDEATHGINAYEMIRKGNPWINTLRYNVDYYNSKPPLMLWLIMLGYRIWGYGPLGLRFFSALAGLLIYIISFIFMYRTRGRGEALAFAAFFPACTQLFDFHMLRSGDMDAVFALWMLLGVIALYKAYGVNEDSGNVRFLLLYGVAAGLAFMTKATHVMVLLAIGFLFVPFIVKKFGWISAILHYLAAAGMAALVILPWAVQRIRFDGGAFFRVMLFGETVGRVEGNAGNPVSGYFVYALQLLHEPVCVMALVLIAVAAVMAVAKYGFLKIRPGYAVHNSAGSASNVSGANSASSANSAGAETGGKGKWEGAVCLLPDPSIYLPLCWFIATLGAYSITKSELCWYIYSAYIPLMMLGADAMVFIYKAAAPSVKYVTAFICAVLFAVPAVLSIMNTRRYPWVTSGGSPRIAFHDDLAELSAKDLEDFSGRTAYIENGFNISKDPDQWEHDYIFYAYTTLDVDCRDGGVAAFLADDDMDAVLMLDKNLWDAYAPVLTGHVILEDNTYLVFNKHHYGE